MGTALLGIVGTFILLGIVGFLISLIGRVTNTTYVTRGGSRIEPYKTPSERKAIKEQEQFARDVNQLNLFCTMFSEKKLDPFATEYGFLSQNFSSLNLSNSISNAESRDIINRGNMYIALKHYANLNSMKEDGLINNREYTERGESLYKKLSS